MRREGVHLPDGGGAEDAGRLFDGRSQLVVYHFMFGPDYTAGCPTCSHRVGFVNSIALQIQRI
jgi:predicted dithiol-disulfide oxidoreductase (DUF899 family)